MRYREKSPFAMTKNEDKITRMNGRQCKHVGFATLHTMCDYHMVRPAAKCLLRNRVSVVLPGSAQSMEGFTRHLSREISAGRRRKGATYG